MSARAVRRARRKGLSSDFLVADIFSEEVDARAPFDLVTAFEVLYYMQDVPGVIQRMQEIGRACFVTYFEQRDALDRYVLSVPGVSSEVIEFGKTRWRAAWWWNSQALRRP